MGKQVISTDDAPAAVGAYSQGIIANGLVFTAGQVPLIPGTSNLAEGGIEAQTRQVMNNIKGVLEASGSSMSGVVKTTVFLADINDFGAFNAVYSEYFPQEPPARTTVQAGALPIGALIEVEAVAVLES
ncbi:MAG: RidA family protein [Chloroflexota bacterium]|nr:RidA family protein [Chloroflexota bacterium]MDE2856740.1 RidA family protein [Chloroflexota bacterium]MDE2950044.1 RidA family protein [Chloroflexota bacterium]